MPTVRAKRMKGPLGLSSRWDARRNGPARSAKAVPIVIRATAEARTRHTAFTAQDHTDQIASARCGTQARRDAFSASDTPSVPAMNAGHIKGRLHDAMHRGSHEGTEEELGE